MKISKEAVLGAIFVLILVIALILYKNKKCEIKPEVGSDKYIKEVEDSLRRENKKKDSIIRINDSLLKLSESRENKIQYIYVERYRTIDRADIRGKDSILRANLGIRR